MIRTLTVAVLCGLAPSAGAALAAPDQTALGESIDKAAPKKANDRDPALVAKAEILLDRTHVSPGVIDGLDGDNFRNAVRHSMDGLAGRLTSPNWVATRVRLTGADRRQPSRVASFGCSKTTFFEASSETHCAWSDSSIALVETSGGSAPTGLAGAGGGIWAFGACAPTVGTGPDAARRRVAAAARKGGRISLGRMNSNAACTKVPGG
jgi:hypothetical protein